MLNKLTRRHKTGDEEQSTTRKSYMVLLLVVITIFQAILAFGDGCSWHTKTTWLNPEWPEPEQTAVIAGGVTPTSDVDSNSISGTFVPCLVIYIIRMAVYGNLGAFDEKVECFPDYEGRCDAFMAANNIQDVRRK